MTERACRKCGATEDLLLIHARGGVVEWECKNDAACLRRQRREGPAREILHRDPAITCQWNVLGFDPESDPEPCLSLSWFAVERSDRASPKAALPDEDYTRGEACEYHLAEVIDWMLSGDEKLHAIVTPRWWDDPPGEG